MRIILRVVVEGPWQSPWLNAFHVAKQKQLFFDKHAFFSAAARPVAALMEVLGQAGTCRVYPRTVA